MHKKNLQIRRKNVFLYIYIKKNHKKNINFNRL